MDTPLPPLHLKLVARHGRGHPVPVTRRHRRHPSDGRSRVLGRGDLFETVERVGKIAPDAPLSFLVLVVDGLADLPPVESELTAHLVAGRIISLTRSVDTVGRMGEASFGVLLQGTGSTAAGAVAARLSYHVSQALHGLSAELGVRVSAATGTGTNWATLPVAATPALPDCG